MSNLAFHGCSHHPHDFGAQQNNIWEFPFFAIYLPWSDGTKCMIVVFECWVLSQLFHFPFSPSSKVSLVPLHFLSLGFLTSNMESLYSGIIICLYIFLLFNYMWRTWEDTPYHDFKWWTLLSIFCIVLSHGLCKKCWRVRFISFHY